MEPPTIHQDSPAWILFVYISFLLSLGLMGLGIDLLPVSLWIKGYFVMGLFFLTGSTLTLSKPCATSMKPGDLSTASARRKPKKCSTATK